ncbi:MAG: DNA-directed RNA polymerase subunit omega [Armatimonadota bacterium]|nr:DNA-directed RNA polymerase subunit omega [bacterium]
MIYPSADKLEIWGSKYALVVLAAKRAKQIKSGAPPMINTDSRNPLTIALEEIAAGKINCVVAETDAVIPTAQEPEAAQLLAIPLRSDEDTEEETRKPEEETILASDDMDLAVDEEEIEDEEDSEVEDLDAWAGGLPTKDNDDLDEEPETHLGMDPALVAIPDDEDTPKPKRGRKASAAPDADADIDIDVDLDADIDLDIEDEDSVVEDEPSED